MSRIFEYEESWEEQILTCTECNWKGTFREGDTEMYAEVMDSSCPNCDIILAVVSYPTTVEAAGYRGARLPPDFRKNRSRDMLS